MIVTTEKPKEKYYPLKMEFESMEEEKDMCEILIHFKYNYCVSASSTVAFAKELLLKIRKARE